MIGVRHLVPFVLFLVALGVAVPLRFLGLEARPMHTDEAVHAMKLGELVEEGRWEYDPVEYHGPTLPYSALVVSWLAGDRTTADVSKTTVRLTVALYGIALLLLLLLVVDGLTPLGTGFAALFTAVSPMVVYYSRYFIMEVPFVVFTLGMIGAGWRYYLSRRGVWAVLAGVFAGLVFATKETCIITYFAVGCAAAGTYLVDFFLRGDSIVIDRRRKPPFRPGHLAAGAAAAATVAVILFSSFFTNWGGVLDSLLTYKVYFGRAGGGGHEHPLFYYFGLLVGGREGGFLWTEAAVLVLGAIGAVAAFAAPPQRGLSLHLVRFLVLYTVLSFAVYSILSYKTPWTILSAYHGVLLLAGFGAATLTGAFRSTVARVVVCGLVLAAAAHLFRQAYFGSFRFFAHERNPYVYAHTAPDFENLVKRVRQLAALKAVGDPLTVQVVHPEFAWPLPYYLRDLSSVGFQQEIPAGVGSADMIVMEAGAAAGFGASVAGTHVKDGPYGLRADALLTVFIKEGLWDTFIASQKRADGS